MRGPILILVLILTTAFQEAPRGEVQPPTEDPASEQTTPDEPSTEEPPTEESTEQSLSEQPTEQTAPADTTETAPAPEAATQDSTQTVSPDERQDPTMSGINEPELVEVPVWPPAETPAMQTVATDSTLRWLMALEWSEYLSNIPGSIAYRTGNTVGRPPAIHLDGFEMRHHQLRLEQLDITDPVTGQVFWPRVPYHNIRTVESSRNGPTYETSVLLRDHYLIQPRTYLNFDEGAGNYRHLEFAFTHNIRPRTNLEIAFWDRRDGSNYRRSDLEGRQLNIRIRQHLSDAWLLKGGYHNNALDQQEPFGYQIPDPELFVFNPFATPPVETSSNGNRSSNDLYAQLYHRPDGQGDPVRAVGLAMQNTAYELTYSRDTTAYGLQDLNLFAWQELAAGNASMRVRGDAHLLKAKDTRSMPGENWMLWEANARVEWPMWGGPNDPRFTLYGQSGLSARSDDQSGYSLQGGVRWRPLRALSWDLSISNAAQLPTLQSLYWQSAGYAGNEQLSSEESQQIVSELTWRPGSIWELGVRGGWRETDRAALLEEIPGGVDGTGNPLPSTWAFVEGDPYETRFASTWFGMNARHWEGELSATVREISSRSTQPAVQSMMQGDPPLWLKGELFWKGNLFSSATYVKGGLRGMWTPGGYRPAQFHVPLNRWQTGGTGDLLSDFSRLDLEVSSRIRWFMLLLRYENLLDGVTQRGYFEADRYPMPGRRLIVALRVLFTN